MPLVFAPLLFVTPLLFFTAPLLQAKQQGLTELGALGVRYADQFEAEAHAPISDPSRFVDLGFAIGGLAALEQSYHHVEHMRIVPFDLKSLSQLVLSSASPFLPLLLKDFPPLAFLSGLGGGPIH